jgi:hypothetical protein
MFSFNLTEWFGPVGMELRGERERSPKLALPCAPQRLAQEMQP